MNIGQAFAVAVLLSSGPFLAGTAVAQYPGGYGLSGGVTSSGVAGPQYGGDQLYPFESNEVWLHGYYQEIPAYGGYHAFAPYNYKHLLSQSQTAAGFGMSPVMPYSQQFWHRYENRANLSPYADEPRTSPGTPMPLPGQPYSYRPLPLPVAPQSPAGVLPAGMDGPVIVPANAETRGTRDRWNR